MEFSVSLDSDRVLSDSQQRLDSGFNDLKHGH